MKKLMMFAAAMTIVGGAYASDCDTCETDCSCSIVYEFKASVKTTAAKDLPASSACDSATCYRKCDGDKVKGYMWYCGLCECDAIQAGLQFAAKVHGDDGKFAIGSEDAGVNPTWTILNLIGKKDDQVEALWSVEDADTGYSFTAAGCGKYDTKNARIKNISGTLVGMGPGPSCEASCDASTSAAVTLLCEVSTETEKTVLYGDWSLKYNSKYSKEGCTCDSSVPNFKW